jgi:hypothetical protein
MLMHGPIYRLRPEPCKNGFSDFWFSRYLCSNNLFRDFFFQTMTPFIFSYLPILTSFIFSNFLIDLPYSVNLLLSCMIHVAQLLDPIWMFTFVREFREPFRCLYTKRISTVVSITGR